MSPRTPQLSGVQAAGLVTQMAVSTVAGGWLGALLDAWLATDWLTALGFVLGFAIGMLALFRHLSRSSRDDDDDPTPPSA